MPKVLARMPPNVAIVASHKEEWENGLCEKDKRRKDKVQSGKIKRVSEKG